MQKKWAAAVLVVLVTQTQAVCDKNAEKLVAAYPKHLLECRANYIIWQDGSKQLYDDGKKKDFAQLLESPDIEDMFAFGYPMDEHSYDTAPEVNHDPGRIRNEAFFKKMYGDAKAVVRQHLVSIHWLPKTAKGKVQITDVNGIDKKLQQVSKSLDALPKGLKKYVIKHAGTFNWRYISGTKRLSAHAFGAAIDINTQYANYWKWSKVYRYQNQIPKEIIQIFEDNGFIWGGKWYHYDTMHFEYRPELLPQKEGS